MHVYRCVGWGGGGEVCTALPPDITPTTPTYTHTSLRHPPLPPLPKHTQALMPVAVFSVGCIFKTNSFDSKTFGNMLLVTLGVAIASYGEINFHLVGVMYQMASIVSESIRLVLVQMLLQVCVRSGSGRLPVCGWGCRARISGGGIGGAWGCWGEQKGCNRTTRCGIRCRYS